MTTSDKEDIEKIKAENIRLLMLVKVLKEALSKFIDTSVELESALLAERYMRDNARDSVVTVKSTHEK